MSKYYATVHYPQADGEDTINSRNLKVIEYFEKNHCNVVSIEETRILRNRDTSPMYRHSVSFEDGVGGVTYGSIGEVIQVMTEADFISIRRMGK